ncbi:MBOAT family O-acyltransferase [Desulfogranum japonicum]|uniref:MBOAT family O-acyltransferase n=1 Tax=Desulfogranum japonicum TaxID=231447 RepID=UPI000425CD82|nr:MBOAT family O-acyltransferase [Desulfogranum japonicum]
MIFSSTVFLFLFLPIVLTGYYCIPGIRLRNLCLLLASLFFYAWGEGIYLILMLFSIFFNYGIGLLLAANNSPFRAKLFLTLAITIDLGMLGAFKYANFLVESLNMLLHQLEIAPLELAPIHLPIGISFFTFQALSYVIDVFRKQTRVQRNVLDCGLYIALFPQLIAGPIVRYHDIALQLRNRQHTPVKFHSGIILFIIGLSKKMLLANPMGSVADQIFALPVEELSLVLSWSGAIAYTLQIYFDFSGYSDMAIGLGRMFGFEFLINFNYPYTARSFREFWQRWHISLSRWFRDYLYIPLGGNRYSPWRTGINLWIVFLLCGLWHGASWNFVLWGTLHGCFLIGERFLWGTLLSTLPNILRHMYLLFGVLVTWVFFRADSIQTGLHFIAAMFGGHRISSQIYPLDLVWNSHSVFVLILACAGATPLFLKGQQTLFVPGSASTNTMFWCIMSFLFFAVLFILCAMELAAGTHNPFIYFRF